MNYYLEVWKKFAQFDGRARRSEYWYFFLFNFIVAFVLALIDVFILGGSESGFLPLTILYSLAVIIPGLAVTIRRLHDIDRSGWWLLINFIPFGGIVLLIFYFMDSTPGDNEYGPNPKEKMINSAF